MENNKSAPEKKVLITGFGPFGSHSVNASWVAVNELSRLWNHQSDSRFKFYALETREIPVAYSFVLESLPQIYKECSPIMCVHVGVSPYKIMKMERCGRNQGYLGMDIHGQCPPAKQCIQDGPEEIRTQFDLEGVCKSYSDLNQEVRCGISEDAGRYLCDFIYYHSLHSNDCPVIFIHVPPLNQPYSSEQLGKALKDLLKVLLIEVISTTI